MRPYHNSIVLSLLLCIDLLIKSDEHNLLHVVPDTACNDYVRTAIYNVMMPLNTACVAPEPPTDPEYKPGESI